MKSLANNDAERLLQERRCFALHTTHFVNQFRKYRLYYRAGERRALCAAPAVLVVRPEFAGGFQSRSCIAGEEPFGLLDSEIAVKIQIETESAVVPAANLNELLLRGEELVFYNDREGCFDAADFAAVETTHGVSAQAIFDKLVEKLYLYRNGVLNSKKLTEIQKNGLQWIEPEFYGEAGQAAAQRITEILLSGVRPENPVNRLYPRSAGLFNFDKGGVNYTPNLGRGEHNVFFEYFIGNRYGRFMPYSFLEVTGDARLSMELYRELSEGGEILDANGRLHSTTGLKGVQHFDAIEQHPELDAEAKARLTADVKNLLSGARLLGVEDARKELGYDRRRIEEDLEHLPADFRPRTYEEVEAFLNQRPGDANGAAEFEQFLAYYQESHMHHEIGSEAVKNRGIVLCEAEPAGDVLLLITDIPYVSAPYYRLLLDFFRRRFPGANVRLAFAYVEPTPRNVTRYAHPIVHALQMMAKLRAQQ